MKTSRQHCASVVALPLLLLTVFARGGEPQDPPPFRIAVNVVRDLSEPDFQVYEDGVRQSIRLFRHEDIPVTVGLVVERSGSMGQKLAEVIAAVVNFNAKVTLGLLAPVRISHRVDELEPAILRAPASGMTALYDAAADALVRLGAAEREKKVPIVISDGGDNASAHSISAVLKMAEQSSALVYTIGIFDEDDPDRNADVLRHLARATGGEAYFPGQIHEVVEICERIAQDIRTQYTIGYISVVKPRVYRSIRVAAAAPKSGKLLVRARSGYIAAESGPVKDEAAR
jgi:Ca-activated chloride channel family protein